jgi:hypothetical protein
MVLRIDTGDQQVNALGIVLGIAAGGTRVAAGDNGARTFSFRAVFSSLYGRLSRIRVRGKRRLRT